MTNLAQAAEKILDGLGNLRRYRIANMAHVESVLAETLKEAVEEALADEKQQGRSEAYSLDTDYHRKIGRAEAYRICAEIAEQYWDHIPQEAFDDGFEIPKKDHPDFVHTDIAKQIRAKAAEEKA
jgi:hypothetical protein